MSGHQRQKSAGRSIAQKLVDKATHGKDSSSSAQTHAASTSPQGTKLNAVTMSLFTTDGPFNALECAPNHVHVLNHVMADVGTQNLLQGNTEDGLRHFYRGLAEAKEAAAADIQQNVHKNYNEFILIAKEISALESDMLVLRETLNDLRLICDGVFGDDARASREQCPSASGMKYDRFILCSDPSGYTHGDVERTTSFIWL